jgi:hypothetical protein
MERLSTIPSVAKFLGCALATIAKAEECVVDDWRHFYVDSLGRIETPEQANIAVVFRAYREVRGSQKLRFRTTATALLPVHPCGLTSWMPASHRSRYGIHSLPSRGGGRCGDLDPMQSEIAGHALIAPMLRVSADVPLKIG